MCREPSAHPWYAPPMAHPFPQPPDALPRARAKLAVLRHLRDHLTATDPRILDGREAEQLVRDVIEVQLVLLDTEILDLRRLITGLLGEEDEEEAAS